MPGAGRQASITDSVRAADPTLTTEELTRLEDALPG
ncbi:hypothetical protein [Streptomyces sp. NBC_00078]|nr:hypothetical protein [Streptomyces sp. NBC_00078]MCX5424918.1 hypothetical protein [Streptomyces sp. NBC_00078]